MTDPRYQQRYVAFADNDPQAYAADVQSRLGHSPANAEKLIRIAQRLGDGIALTSEHVKVLAEIHPEVPARNLADMAAQLNRQHPGDRQSMFLGAVSGDAAAMRGDVHLAGDAFREVSKIVNAYTTYDVVDAINAKRGGSEAPPAWRPEAGSVRDIVARQFETPGAREAAALVDAGHPDAVRQAKGITADRIERASRTLHDEVPDDTRSSVAAAFDYHETEAVAVDQGWLESEAAA